MPAKRKQIDRRWLFLIIFICVAIPLVFTIGLPITVSKNAEKVHDFIDKTPANSRAIISFDYDPGSKPELHPMAKALVKHCFERKIKVIFTALWPMGVSMAEDIISQLIDDFPSLNYGVDYVNLGFKAGGMVTIQAMGKNIKAIFPKDMSGTSIAELPIMDDIDNFNNISFIFSLSAGDPGLKQWVQVAHDSYGCRTSGGVTGVSITGFLPYVNEQEQLSGLLGGLKGAAEYEKLVNAKGTATKGMDAQSLAHLIIIIFIIIGNISFWRNKKLSREVNK